MKFTHALCSTLFCLLAQNALAQASVQCEEHPKSEWRTEAELEAQLTKEGWRVRRIEASCTCFEVFATTPDGKRIAAYFDPKTLERVKDE